MTMYTIMPLEVVTQGMDSHKPVFEEMSWQGRMLLVERISMHEVRIERLLQGTTISDYLEAALQPGHIIRFS
ncbi:YlzJ-like family protein [Paenibacillus sp. ACRRX]|uniref:YlzJ-like family protein n=1 Tax=unclassified Paenibacillus TaxID=185978 RepID=UPI001EF5FDCD|nr:MULTISPECIES: YlzJ-like family protein [unclassified Paenibacillus]MCG7407433.1 YlzJ-like family protein [Paenibacillus sp. ACRRX]MDK8180668.1 YlzJ-like family protein [Paenibacillus sp. UMB4589-SE434]